MCRVVPIMKAVKILGVDAITTKCLNSQLVRGVLATSVWGSVEMKRADCAGVGGSRIL